MAAVLRNLDHHELTGDGNGPPEESPVGIIDPERLRRKYLEERDKRLENNNGVDQYCVIDDATKASQKYLTDPYIEPGFTRDPVDVDCDVIIIGGGYGGLLCAVRLLQQGITNFRIIEKAGDFGGTWYWNRYPGAQCDIESYIYMPLLEETGYMPTEKYSHANELRAHAERIGKQFELYPRTLFQTETMKLSWDESLQRWHTQTNWGDQIRSKFIIPAAGPLHRPKLPGVPGLEEFKGHTFHSSRWDYNYTGGDCTGSLVKLADKRVAIIGTGATAVQIVPHLGQWAKEVYVFQRTPSSIDVRNNRPTDSEWAGRLTKGWQQRRMDNFDILVSGGYQEEDLVSDGWTDIIRKLLRRPDMNSTADPASVAAKLQLTDFEKMNSIRARVDTIVKDPATAEALKPWYNQFCKRPCFHDAYLQTFNRPNVTLVDTNGRGIDRLTERGIVAKGQEYEVDCLIYATGFELATEWSHRAGFEIYGRDGITTSDRWRDGRLTFHGWASRGFPNCFFIGVVQAALSPNFLHVTAEQAAHFAYVIKRAITDDISTVEPTEEAETAWVNTCIELGKPTRSFLKDCTPGYYNNEGQLDSLRFQRDIRYGGGSPAFFKILHEWREADQLEGLELSSSIIRITGPLVLTCERARSIPVVATVAHITGK
ncbi:hypothetical protein FE257_009132 [Aspergillus nanangensis]|uniref:FAD/NAD(P)-binding domain-containing protein n=1 Tax=Aspergillus nanangensis TaxID=2582783 RepID=A0AAD4CWT6_ASPNN|nr:hypothetical protein FE257_009132 [Aspergillus nanangensis]